MKSTYSALVQSRFFNPAFNSAIYDGPVRIYFSQFYEAGALKLYFAIQEKLGSLLTEIKSLGGQPENVLVMAYPSAEAFQMSFDGQVDWLGTDRLESDYIIGVAGAVEDSNLDRVVSSVEKALRQTLGAESISVPLDAVAP